MDMRRQYVTHLCLLRTPWTTAATTSVHAITSRLTLLTTLEMSSSPKPSSPPPAYTEIDPAQLPSSSATPHSPTAFSTHTGYGPTAITAQQQTILPYYDPRSPYALEEATSRARWRFIGALFWAVLILALTSFLLGVEVDIQREPWRGNRVRIGFGKGNTDPWSDQ